jgi:hypothetical protein
VERKTIEALARVSYDAEVMLFLQSRLADCKATLVSTNDDVQMRITQGRARELTDIVEQIKKSSETLRKA